MLCVCIRWAQSTRLWHSLNNITYIKFSTNVLGGLTLIQRVNVVKQRIDDLADKRSAVNRSDSTDIRMTDNTWRVLHGYAWSLRLFVDDRSRCTFPKFFFIYFPILPLVFQPSFGFFLRAVEF